ncbi:hypothetical protein [Alkalicoccobacillus porphyridii]|uniref:Uncharacterized protein n=1 Tax=Alkalicoccobacillus porphyridii TaxID=2597270 RepID=A0A554A3A5_9BACI|nr:hypothetical protein [Alkalicoccobacillus porphyridii]TSB48168.1 hypothetical protein FN960_01010 [Alkalicoccobacillus porphyridii]
MNLYIEVTAKEALYDSESSYQQMTILISLDRNVGHLSDREHEQKEKLETPTEQNASEDIEVAHFHFKG